MAIATINPATGEVVKTFTALTDSQVDEKDRLRGQILPFLPADVPHGPRKMDA